MTYWSGPSWFIEESRQVIGICCGPAAGLTGWVHTCPAQAMLKTMISPYGAGAPGTAGCRAIASAGTVKVNGPVGRTEVRFVGPASGPKRFVIDGDVGDTP